MNPLNINEVFGPQPDHPAKAKAAAFAHLAALDPALAVLANAKAKAQALVKEQKGKGKAGKKGARIF